jgi:2-dehydropantoate 2-reductase
MPGVLDVGRHPGGPDALATAVAGDLTAAGFGSRADPAIMRWKYGKLLGNLGNAAEAGTTPTWRCSTGRRGPRDGSAWTPPASTS